MKNILITGATGNVGMALIKALVELNNAFEIYAGIRDLEKDKLALSGFQLKTTHFDFNDINTFKPALEHCDILFLLRPPQISEVTKIFKPLIETAIQCTVKHIVFISVQGVEKSKIIPHHKIEKLIVDSKINYTFLRPAYFMQNFTTTLRKDLLLNKRIFLPAGKAKFTIVDIADIGKVAAKIISDTDNYVNKSYELTNHEKLSFSEMAKKLSKGLKTNIKYDSPNLFKFFIVKRKDKMPGTLILVMIMLHYLPRFQREPETTDWVNKITNH
jgi:uncharacterized protein YbjT (DUF2867 family)